MRQMTIKFNQQKKLKLMKIYTKMRIIRPQRMRRH